MSGMRPVAGALVCWGVMALSAWGQERSSDQPDPLRQEISQLRALVVELVKRIDSLEKEVARLKPEIDLKAAARPQYDRSEARDEAKPVEIFNVFYEGTMFDEAKPVGTSNGVHKGMMFDAIEHRMRWRERLRAR